MPSARWFVVLSPAAAIGRSARLVIVRRSSVCSRASSATSTPTAAPITTQRKFFPRDIRRIRTVSPVASDASTVASSPGVSNRCPGSRAIARSTTAAAEALTAGFRVRRPGASSASRRASVPEIEALDHGGDPVSIS
jgi:hypothetical protein